MINQRIAIGLIRTSFGLKGELKVESLSGEVSHFLVLKEIFLKDKSNRFLVYKVENSRKHKGMVLLKLEGIDTPEQVKKLHGNEIWVDRQNASPKAENEYYYADLCLCSVYLEEKRIGSINSVIAGNSFELLEVITIDGKTCLIPFIDKYVGKVDIENKQVFLKDESAQL